MSRVWLDEDERNLKLLNDDHRRNIRIIFDQQQVMWALTHPRTTLNWIKSHSPNPPTGD